MKTLVLAALAIAAPASAAPLDDAARAYVALVLEYGEAEAGYVDAYYGPPEWATIAKASPRAVPQISVDAATLLRSIDRVPATGIDAARKRFLTAQLRALSARAAMKQGARYGFADEAEALFGARPVLKPLASYDAVLNRIEKIVPGPGPLSARVAAFRKRYDIPSDKLATVIEAGIAECKARTAAKIAAPPDETFELSFVTNKPWSGYNYYQGNYKSLIQINTDLPVQISRAAAKSLIERYELADPKRAEQRLKFIDTYRSYIINYGLGRDLVQAYVERARPKERWARMEKLLSEPTLPSDLSNE